MINTGLQVDFIPGMQGFFNIHKLINVIHHISKLKDKNHMITSIDAQLAFDKIQHPFMIQTLQKAGIEGTYVKIIKVIYDKPTANIILNGKKNESFSPKVRKKTRVPTLSITIQHSFGSVGHSNQSRKRNKRNPHRKRSKTLTADDMILYIENPKDSTRKLLELINEYSKVAEYKINTQKSLAFLYTNNEKTEREIKETMPFTIARKIVKYLSIST